MPRIVVGKRPCIMQSNGHVALLIWSVVARKGCRSQAAGSIFENWVMGAAKAMDGALAQAESNLEGNGGGKQP